MSDNKRRWILVTIALSVKIVISISQYSWFLFAFSIHRELGWDISVAGLTFSFFVFAATFVQPFSGIRADIHGPRHVALLASFLMGLGFFLSAFASKPLHLTLFYGVAGLGMGALNGISTAIAVKWFPDKRGLTTGIVEFGFGAGTALFNLILQIVLSVHGFRWTFVGLGILMWCTLIPLSSFYRYPPNGWNPGTGLAKSGPVDPEINAGPFEMVRTSQWYIIYFSFSFTISIVLLFGAQMKMLASEFDIPQRYLNALLVVFPLGNGFSRIIAGLVSDRIGRERTMVVFYTVLGLTVFVLAAFGSIPMVFVAAVAFAALLGGSPFALYPSIIGDYYGSRFTTTNYGITITAKAWAGLLSGWLSGFLVHEYGTFRIPLVMFAAFGILAGVFSHPRLLCPPSTLTRKDNSYHGQLGRPVR